MNEGEVVSIPKKLSNRARSSSIRSICTTFILATVMGLAVSHAGAAMITFTTPYGLSMDDHPVSAGATFTTGADSIGLVLENLEPDPTSVVQNLTGIMFTIDTGQTVGTVLSSSSIPRFVAKDETYSDGPTIEAGWELSTIGDILFLNVLGTDAGPAHSLLGPPNASDLYTNANGSIAGNKPHNPFLAEVAEFTLGVPGVTEDSEILLVTFVFNTSPGYDITVPPDPVIPEPATLSLLALGGLFILNRRMRRS